MKLAKGFKGRYFSLAAIAATVSCVNLQAIENSVQSQEQHISQYTEREPDDDVETLEDIVVESALPSSSTLKNITSDVSVITSEEIEEHHYANVLDALDHRTSLFVTQNGGPGQSSSFFLNGMSSEHVLVMIDGIRVNDPTGTKGQAQLEHIRLIDVEQIEIIKGGQSGVWGADAGGGVINIVTKRAAKGFHLSGHLEGGSYTTQNGSLSASYGGERYWLKAGFDGFRTDGFPPKTTSDFDAGDIERTYFASGEVRPTDTMRIRANYRQIVSDYDFEGFNAVTYLPEKQHGDADVKFYNAKIDQEIHGVLFTGFGWGSDFERSIDGNAYKGNEYEAGLKAHYEIAKGQYDIGISYRRSKMDESYGQKMDNDIRDNAVFASLNQSAIDNRLIVNAALRYDDYDAYDDKTTGKIGFKYRLYEEIHLAGNIGLGYRTPSLYERFGGDGYTEANENLKPESTTTYDVQLFGYGAKIGYFYNEITDMIEYVFGIYPAPGHYENLEGISKIQGVEISYMKAFDSIASRMEVSYNYLDAKDQNGDRLLRRPRHRASAQWSVFPAEKFSFNLNVQYAADYLDTRYVGFSRSTIQMGEYIVWNAVANYGTEEDGFFYLKLNNIFNEDYQLVDGYNTEEQSIYVGWRFLY